MLKVICEVILTIIAIASILGVILGVVIVGQRLSPMAMAVVVGAVFGSLLTVTGAVAALALGQARKRQGRAPKTSGPPGPIVYRYPPQRLPGHDTRYFPHN